MLCSCLHGRGRDKSQAAEQTCALAEQVRSQGSARGPAGNPESQEMEAKFQPPCVEQHDRGGGGKKAVL